MVATVRNLTSSSATLEYFRQDGGYYVGSNGDAGALRAKREEHREASAWHGRGAAALGPEACEPHGVAARQRAGHPCEHRSNRSVRRRQPQPRPTGHLPDQFRSGRSGAAAWRSGYHRAVIRKPTACSGSLLPFAASLRLPSSRSSRVLLSTQIGRRSAW